MKQTIVILVFSILSFTTCPPCVLADYSYSDSAEFSINLLLFPTSGTYDYSDSSQFNLDIYPVNRGLADSSEFAFDWLANCNPVYGPLPYGGEVANNNFLKQLDQTGQWIDAYSFPPTGATVIIINHGWNSWPEALRDMANQIASEVPGAYIYSWGWGNGPNVESDANPNGLSPSVDFLLLVSSSTAFGSMRSSDVFVDELQKAKANAYDHGRQLGEVLLDNGIRPDQQNIHMIGHSFGGIVCSEAAKKLFEKTGGVKIKQLTTLETPKLPFVNALEKVEPDKFERVEVIYYDGMDLSNLLNAATGGPLAGGYDNVLNLELEPMYYSGSLHTMAVGWYAASADPAAINCEDNRYGFGWSFALDPLYPYWDILGYQKESLWLDGQGCLATWQGGVDAVVSVVVDKVNEGFASAADWIGDMRSTRKKVTMPLIFQSESLKTIFTALRSTSVPVNLRHLLW